MTRFKVVLFNEFWPFFKQEARERGYNQAEFMEKCGLPKTRYNGFNQAGSKGGMNLTAHYMLLLMEGLRVTESYIETKSGRRLTDEQKTALNRARWTANNQDVVDYLLKNKKLLDEIRSRMTEKP